VIYIYNPPDARNWAPAPHRAEKPAEEAVPRPHRQPGLSPHHRLPCPGRRRPPRPAHRRRRRRVTGRCARGAETIEAENRAMKLKLKLDKRRCWTFCLQNVEKIVFGVIGLIFVFDALLLTDHRRAFGQDARTVADGNRQGTGRHRKNSAGTPSWT